MCACSPVLHFAFGIEVHDDVLEFAAANGAKGNPGFRGIGIAPGLLAVSVYRCAIA